MFIAKLRKIEKYHFGDSDPAGFDILADLRARSGDEIGSLHMTFRNSADAQPFTEKDMAIAERVLKSIHLTNSEKSHILKMTELGDKGIYEQEMLGVPSQRHWPYY